jgi:hypothetical protein
MKTAASGKWAPMLAIAIALGAWTVLAVFACALCAAAARGDRRRERVLSGLRQPMESPPAQQPAQRRATA